MQMINITLPDGSVRQYEQGVTSMDVAMSISEGLARNVLAASVNGETWDATRPIFTDASVRLFTWNDKEGKLLTGTRLLTLWLKHWNHCILVSSLE